MATLTSNSCFIDQDCTISHKGQSFESGGAFIGKDKDGKHGGVIYGDWDYKTVSNWNGSIKIPAKYYSEHRGNMGDKRIFVKFTYKGINFFGRWCGLDWSQLIPVKQCQ